MNYSKPPRKSIYRVWQAISEREHMTRSEIADRVKLSRSTVHRCLRELAAVGVISQAAKTSRSIVVHEPFNWFQGD